MDVLGGSGGGDFRRDEIGGPDHENVGMVEALVVAGAKGLARLLRR